MTPALQRSVPFFDYRHVFLAEEEELVGIFRDTGRRGAFILQEDLARFEADSGGVHGSAATPSASAMPPTVCISPCAPRASAPATK